MSSTSSEADDVGRFPDLELAQQKFLLGLPEYHEDADAKGSLLAAIRANDMAPWYEVVCRDLGWSRDEQLLTSMRTNNDEALRTLEEAIEAAEQHSGTTDVKEAILKKANYLTAIGDKENAVATLSRAYHHTVALGYRLDNIFTCTRIGFFFMDHKLIRRSLDRAEGLVQLGADYDRRNRLKIYQGFYGLAIRDFKTAASNFLAIVSTFTCYELMDYTTFIRYTVFATIITLPRKELEEKVIRASDILEVLYGVPEVKKYIFSLYQCDYAEFLRSLAEVEQSLRRDYILYPHYRFYVREMRILAYSQMLVSYKSLTLEHMAKQFDVTPEFIEGELSRFVAEGRIYAKIDKVKGVVVTSNRMERKSELFKNVIRQGDLLMNRIQRLSRLVDR